MACSGRKLLPCHVVGMKLNLYHFPNKMFHMSGFLGQDTGCSNILLR